MEKKDGVQCNRHGTRKYCVFNHSSAVFRGKNCNIVYPIIKYSTKLKLHILSNISIFNMVSSPAFFGAQHFLTIAVLYLFF